ncbi:MAG TPA: cytidine deaminase [Propionibacteriaceae bacterium]|nr:cytidine deaminase [Propionibacteriaceae bacterium]
MTRLESEGDDPLGPPPRAQEHTGARVATPSDPEDLKIITLARSTRARTGAAAGACLRDTDGRTYAGASVALPHLQLSAIQVAVAMAVSSGAPGLEAVALVGDSDPSPEDLAVLGDLRGTAVSVWRADASGTAQSLVTL